MNLEERVRHGVAGGTANVTRLGDSVGCLTLPAAQIEYFKEVFEWWHRYASYSSR